MDKDKLKREFDKEIGFTPPGIMVAEKFGGNMQEIITGYHHEIWGRGVIPLKYRYLIALATAVFDENDTRARLELSKAVRYGATKDEIMEVLKQQVWMKGSPMLVKLVPLIKFMEAKFKE